MYLIINNRNNIKIIVEIAQTSLFLHRSRFKCWGSFQSSLTDGSELVPTSNLAREIFA